MKGTDYSKTRQHQLLLTMKVMAFMLLMTIAHLCSNAQDQLVTFSGKNVSLEKVFEAMEKQTGVCFLYDSSTLKQARKVNIDVNNEPLEEVLNSCFSNQPLVYKVFDKTVVILEKKDNSTGSELLRLLINLIVLGISVIIFLLLSISGREESETYKLLFKIDFLIYYYRMNDEIDDTIRYSMIKALEHFKRSIDTPNDRSKVIRFVSGFKKLVENVAVVYYFIHVIEWLFKMWIIILVLFAVASFL